MPDNLFWPVFRKFYVYICEAQLNSLEWMMKIFRILLLILFTLPVFSLAQDSAKSAAPQIPYDRGETTDKYQRKITFYLSKTKDPTAKLPLAVFVQGSGCESLFVKVGDQIGGGIQNLLLQIVRGKARLLVVEKPGVNFLDLTETPGAAEKCSAEFLREHTFERWAAAVDAAIKEVVKMPQIDTSRILVAGHSEGGDIAAKVAADNPGVTHVASLSAGGPTQLFDLIELARTAPGAKGDPSAQFYQEWAKIVADPDSTTKFFYGHPYRRWSSFMRSSVLRELLRAKARIFIAHGSADTSVPVVSFDVLRAELVTHGKDVTAERIEGVGHSFSADPLDADGLRSIFTKMANWFLG